MIGNQRSTFFHSLAKGIRFRIANTLRLFMSGLIRLKTNVSGHNHSSNRTATLFGIAHHTRRALQAIRNINVRAANRRFAKNQGGNIVHAHRANSKIRRGSGIFLVFGRAFHLLSGRFDCLGIAKYQFIRNKDSRFTFRRALRLNRFFQAFIGRRRRRRTIQVIMNSTLHSVLRRRNFAHFQQHSGRAALATAS